MSILLSPGMAVIKRSQTYANLKIILRQPFVFVFVFLNLVVHSGCFWLHVLEHGFSSKSADNKSYPKALTFLRRMGRKARSSSFLAVEKEEQVVPVGNK